MAWKVCTAGHGKSLMPCLFLDKVWVPCSPSLPLSTYTFPFFYRPGRKQTESPTIPWRINWGHCPLLPLALSCRASPCPPSAVLTVCLFLFSKESSLAIWLELHLERSPLLSRVQACLLFSQNHEVFTHTLSCNPRVVPKLYPTERIRFYPENTFTEFPRPWFRVPPHHLSHWLRPVSLLRIVLALYGSSDPLSWHQFLGFGNSHTAKGILDSDAKVHISKIYKSRTVCSMLLQSGVRKGVSLRMLHLTRELLILA